MQRVDCILVALLTVAAVVDIDARAEETRKDEVTCGSVRFRVDCSSGVPERGLLNLTSEQCAARGCCYDDETLSCYYRNEGVPIRTLHMINSNHFDAGYADLTADVVNLYFDEFFPRAAAVGKDLRTNASYSGRPGAGQPLKWMTFSYLLSLFFDCPPDMGLHCPNASSVEVVRDAIINEDIVWPAFPHNAELAIGDASFLRFGVELSQSMERRFNTSGVASSVLSTRDVPGMPRSAIPILKRAGVLALSEGMNGRIVPVNVPPAFVWRALDNETTMPVLWHWHGYGKLKDPGNPVQLPGCTHAIAYVWRDDNTGPPMNAEEVLQNAETLLAKLNATSASVHVVSSSLGAFVQAATSEGAWDRLPVIEKDLADSWIWGVGSDPVKVQRMRSLARARTECERSGDCSTEDPAYWNFSRLALKNLEHTWGVSVSHYGNESDADWDNKAFHERLREREPHFAVMVESWKEQRAWGVDYPLSALPDDHPVRVAVRNDFAEMVANISTVGLTRVNDTSVPIGKRGGRVVFSRDDGSIHELRQTADGASYASAEHPLGLVRYQTLVKADFDAWHAEYLLAGTGGGNEYGKPDSFMDASTHPTRHLASVSLREMWTGTSAGGGDTIVLLKTAFDDTTLHDEYGAPEYVWIQYAFNNSAAEDDALLVRCRLTLVNKTATRLPEATWVTFDTPSPSSRWQHNVLGSWQDPTNVADGASKGLHYTSEDGVRRDDGSVHVRSIDTGLLRWGAPLPFPTPLHDNVDLSVGASYNLHNNIWNTNYPDWLPFDALGRDMVFRFEVRVGGGA